MQKEIFLQSFGGRRFLTMGLLPCRTCNKTGKRIVKMPCPECGGYGLVRDKNGQFVVCPNTGCKGG